MERRLSNDLPLNRRNLTGLLRFLVVTIILALPLLSWLASIGNPFAYFRYELPPGQVLYILAKLAGMYAFVLLWFQAMMALLKRDRLSGYLVPEWTLNRHRVLGIATILTAWTHFLCFFSAVSIRKETVAYDLLLPQFQNGIYSFAVSLGWIALVGLTLVAFTGLLRGRRQGIWALAHRLSLVVFLLAFFHAQMIGSEAKDGLWFFLHLLFVAAILVAIARRVTDKFTATHR